MSRNEKLQFGHWNIGGTDFILNGILNVNDDINNVFLYLYSDEPLALPYYTDVVYGTTYNGNAFTLYDCKIGGGFSSSGVHDYKTKYMYKVNSSYVLEGAIFTKEQEILIKEVSFSVTNLNKWADQEALDIKFDDSSEYIITKKNLDDITHTNEEFVFSIKYITMPNYSYTVSSSLNIQTNARLVIKFHTPTGLVRVHSLINQVRDFFSLCTTTRTYIEYITAKPQYPTPQEFEFPINIYGQLIEFGKKENINDLKFYHNYISLEQIKKDFNLCMKNWFEKSEKLQPVIDLYLSINYHRTSNERHFLNLVQALEAYHRLTRKNEVLPKDEHKKKMEKIIANIPEEYQSWVKAKLAFSNEPSLHERLEELLTPKSKSGSPHHDSQLRHIFKLENKEKIEIIRDIKYTRNYNTHFDERLLKKSLQGEELFQLILLLSLMMEYYLLMELEIDEETVINLIRQKSKQIDDHISILETTRKGNIKFFM
ncbi:HEPN domain-containing protein [Bacillus gobiensis]|uniref:HEPN domain-containing protein n=1 Tax=Bacillus gobiensis TaxID=1441095 RepID=UPI003D2153BE